MKCPCCDKQSVIFKTFSTHLRKEHRSSTRFKCTYNCSRLFANINAYLKHIKYQHFKDFQFVTLNSDNNPKELSFVNDTDLETINFSIEQQFASNINEELLKIILKVISDDRTPRTTSFNTLKELFSYYDVGINSVLFKTNWMRKPRIIFYP